MIARSQTVTVLSIGLAALVGFGDTLGSLTVFSYLLGAGQLSDAAHGTIVDFALSIIEPALVLIAAFVSGVVAGSLTGHWSGDRRQQAVLILVALLFIVISILDDVLTTGQALVLLAIALGALNAVLEDVPGAFVGGLELLRRFGERLAGVFTGEPSSELTADIPLFVGLVLGIAGGAILYSYFGLASLWLAALTAGLLAAWSAVLRPEIEA